MCECLGHQGSSAFVQSPFLPSLASHLHRKEWPGDPKFELNLILNEGCIYPEERISFGTVVLQKVDTLNHKYTIYF